MSEKIHYIRNSDGKGFRLISNTNRSIVLESQDGNQITIPIGELNTKFIFSSELSAPTKIIHGNIQLPNLPTAAGIMQDAMDTMAERGKTYDSKNNNAAANDAQTAPVERSMGKVVTMFNTLTGHKLTEEQGWDFMVLLKLARASNGYKADNFVDGAAYFSLAGECAAEENREKN